MTTTQTPPVDAASTPPPQHRPGPVEWARANLFDGWKSSLLTVVVLLPLTYGAYRALRFVFFTGRWQAIRTNLTLVMVGLFPRPEIWRAWIALYVVVAGVGLAIGVASRALIGGDRRTRGGWRETAVRIWPIALFGAVVLGFSAEAIPIALTGGIVVAAIGAFVAGRRAPARLARYAWVVGLLAVLVAGGVLARLGGVALSGWGGLLLTMTLAVTGIVVSFPFGVLAALGRRSRLPGFKVVSVGYIEFIRGVPLITLLFLGDLALQFFVPPSLAPGKVVRAMTMMVLFTGAYVAEIVRGGLQSVPRGQIEAAQALGLKPVGVIRKIVLPQALRNVIPALVGQFISLFKDTSLVAIIGLNDLLNVLRSIIPGQPDFRGQGLLAELLAFAAFAYWAFAYTMSRESQRLERRLGVGER